MKKKPVIAIDGFSSTGKSSISKKIAKKLDLIHIDTGALYRGITFFALENCLNDQQEIDIKSLFSKLNEIHLEFRPNHQILELYPQFSYDLVLSMYDEKKQEEYDIWYSKPKNQRDFSWGGRGYFNENVFDKTLMQVFKMNMKNLKDYLQVIKP